MHEITYSGLFSLEENIHSGQVFHWQAHELDGVPGYEGCIGVSPPIWIGQDLGGAVFTNASTEGIPLVRRYFGLDHDLGEIHATFPGEDQFLHQAMEYCPGIRIMRQPFWECLATFITSSMKQVAHIRGISLQLRERAGQAYQGLAGEHFAYPTPQAMAALGEQALRECALGYRAKALHLAAQNAADGVLDLDGIEEEKDRSLAHARLMENFGVGAKIAHCALLFGAGNWGSFPIDVWIERVLKKAYRKRVKGPKLQLWAERHFGPYSGYAQQYLFKFSRENPERLHPPSRKVV